MSAGVLTAAEIAAAREVGRAYARRARPSSIDRAWQFLPPVKPRPARTEAA